MRETSFSVTICWYFSLIVALSGYAWWNWNLISSLSFWGLTIHHMAIIFLLFMLSLPFIDRIVLSREKCEFKLRNPFRSVANNRYVTENDILELERKVDERITDLENKPATINWIVDE